MWGVAEENEEKLGKRGNVRAFSAKSRRLAARQCDSKAARFVVENEQVPPAATRRNSRTQGSPMSWPKCTQRINEGTPLKTAAVLCACVNVTRKPQSMASSAIGSKKEIWKVRDLNQNVKCSTKFTGVEALKFARVSRQNFIS